MSGISVDAYAVYLLIYFMKAYETKREKTYLLTYAPNENSNQLAYPCSLIRAFVAKCADLDHSAHAQRIIRAFALHSYIL